MGDVLDAVAAFEDGAIVDDRAALALRYVGQDCGA